MTQWVLTTYLRLPLCHFCDCWHREFGYFLLDHSLMHDQMICSLYCSNPLSEATALLQVIESRGIL